MAFPMLSNSSYDIIMNTTLAKTEPKTQTMAFQIYKSMWLKDNKRFVVIADLHQNSLNDCLHFSVEVDICEGWKHRLHFNGFYKDKFIVCNITAQSKDRLVFHSEVVAEFDC